MPERDTLEFATAVLLGTVLGAGITLLLRGEDDRRSDSPGLLSRGSARAGRAAEGVTREARTLGRELAGAARDEAADFLTEAGKRLLRGTGRWKDGD